MPKSITFVILYFILVSMTYSQTRYQADWTSINSRPVPQWFQDAKFGIFIHWGLYSVPAWGPTQDVGVYEKYAEWYWHSLLNPERESHRQFKEFHTRTYGPDFDYRNFAERFTCEMYEPQKWAEILQGSGAKYVVLTSKHHEGFALWPSMQSGSFNAMESGPKRDLLGELTEAVRAKQLRMGYYYSLYEWYNPLYKESVDTYVDSYMLPQMKDLVSRYKPDVFWTDGEWEHPSATWRSTEFLSWLYNDSPVKEYVAVNDRWGSETRGRSGGFYTTEYDLIHDQNVSAALIEHPWEECRGIGTSFGYNRNEALDNYSTSEQLVHILIDKVARGGNLLLNIGPTSDGRIPVIMQQRLNDIGKWLKINGEAIYGTRQWQNAPITTAESKILFTAKDNDLYVICRSFPTQDIVIEGVVEPQNIRMLGSDGTVNSKYINSRLVLEPPFATAAGNSCPYAWVYKLQGVLEE